MVNLTFGEQVKIILSRKGMTIKQLAELVEAYTGKPMSRQNMTQRLGRDNFQEQDMRMIAEILGCKFRLSIMEEDQVELEEMVTEEPLAREITVGELVDIIDDENQGENVQGEVANSEAEESHVMGQAGEASEKDVVAEAVGNPVDANERELLKKGVRGFFSKKDGLEVQREKDLSKSGAEKQEIVGDINPYTGKEYKSNSVRMHPKRIGYVQVYDQEQHKWTDMTEWAFLGYQERKKVLLGKDYVPPTYLD